MAAIFVVPVAYPFDYVVFIVLYCLLAIPAGFALFPPPSTLLSIRRSRLSTVAASIDCERGLAALFKLGYAENVYKFNTSLSPAHTLEHTH